MTDDPKNGADGSTPRSRRPTPITISRSAEDAARRLITLKLSLRESGRMHVRTYRIIREMERLVRNGGNDADARALEMRLALHFAELSEYVRDELANRFAGTGRALERLSKG